MIIILTPEDQTKAINNYLDSVYNLSLSVSEDRFTDIEVVVNPPQNNKASVENSNDEEEDEDNERQEVIDRANELGINFRSDIKTSTLIQRIEDEEERIAKKITEPEPLPMDESLEETYEKTEDNEDEEEEETELSVSQKKPSIFDRKK